MNTRAHDLACASRVRFRSAIERSETNFDTAQLAVIDALERPSRHGYYLWGGVGRGKTLIADAYFAAIPTTQKRRFHFHDFFRDLQTQIIGKRTPLHESLQLLIGDTRAVLFDEFHVHDVADGVYLTATLTALLERDILTIATSNYAPETLMPNPLTHERFRPAISLIETELAVLHIGDGEDYRVTKRGAREGFGAGTWRMSAPEHTHAPRDAHTPRAEMLTAAGHAVHAVSLHEDAGVFTFGELCARPLGVLQYLWLAERLQELTLIDVPDLATADRDSLARFTNLIDVLYDQGVRLHVCVIGDPSQLLKAQDPPRDVTRTVSRLSLLERV